MKKNILSRTNLLICIIIIVGFALTAMLSYQANYSASLQNIEQVSDLTCEGIYHQLTGEFTKPVNISLTMANDSLLRELLEDEAKGDDHEQGRIQEYLSSYREKYGYDSVFLVSQATKSYYHFAGLDRVLEPDDPEDTWYFDLLESGEEYDVVVDNDEVEGAENEITIFVNCKIMGDNGKMMGAVGVGLRVRNLQALLQSYEKEFGVQPFLVSPQGIIEVSTEHTGYKEVDLFELRGYGEETRGRILGEEEKDGTTNFWSSEREGGNYIVARFIPELGWHLVVEQNTEDIISAMHWQLLITVVIILLITIIILCVVTSVIRSFNKRIVTLTTSIEQERRTLFEKATEELYEDIYEIDITHNCPANQATEQYFRRLGVPPGASFDASLQIVAERQVKEEFRRGYLETFSPENVLKAFERGEETLKYEFMISNDGENYYWMRIIARLVQWGSDGSVHMLVYRQNIDAEKRREDIMQALAQTDEMTGLYTRTAVGQHIEELLKKAPEKICALFIFDIDTFKEANDLYGHVFGDGVIQEFVSVLKRSFRRDDLLGRLGGDEFVAFLPVPDVEWVRDKASTLVSDLDKDFTKDGKTWHMSSSIGIAFAPWDATGFEELYAKADQALYETKKSGRCGYTIFRATPSSEDLEEDS